MMFLPNFKEMSFDRWMQRSVDGLWISDRRYLYYSPEGDAKAVNLTTQFTCKREQYGEYTVSWTGQTSGTMVLTLDRDVLHRSIGYYSNKPTDSQLERIDEDTVVFRTSYGGADYREEVRYVGDDLRLRQTVGWDAFNERMILAGQYVERRVS